MAAKKKIALTNLNDLRADLGLTLAEMAAAIKPITRQTLGAIESGEPKDAIFMRVAFIRMKAAFADRFEVFDLVEEPNFPNSYFISYRTVPKFEIVDPHFERLSFQIMALNNKIRRMMKSDNVLLGRQEDYLRELLDTLFEHLRADKAA